MASSGLSYSRQDLHYTIQSFVTAHGLSSYSPQTPECMGSVAAVLVTEGFSEETVGERHGGLRTSLLKLGAGMGSVWGRTLQAERQW